MRDVRETAGMRGPRKHCGSNRWIRGCHGASVTVTGKPSCRGRNSTRAIWWACILCSFCISPASRTGRAPRCTTNHHNKDVVRDRTAARGWAVAGPLFAMLEVVACVWPCERVSCVPLAFLLRREADTRRRILATNRTRAYFGLRRPHACRPDRRMSSDHRLRKTKRAVRNDDTWPRPHTSS